jgi:hypothetical protein
VKAEGIAIGVLVFAVLAGAVFGQSRPFEIQVSFGGWSLSPFRTLVENQCERLIKNEFDKLVASAIPDFLLSPFLSNVDISSSGRFFSVAMWYRFGESHLSAGIRGDYIDFKLPFVLSAEETLAILGFPLVALDGQGRGTVRLDGVVVSLLGRWTPLSTSRVELSFQGGLMVLPFQGEILLSQTTALRTPIGDLQLSGSFDQTIAEVRDLGLDLPSFIFSPTLGIEFRYRFAAHLGLYVNATAAQGSFYSGGLFFSF